MPFGYSAIGGLLSEMEATKRRMQQPLAPPPDAFRLPQPGGLLPPTPPQSPMQDPMANVANANVSDPNDLSYQHRPGIRGAALRLLGADRVPKEIQALLSPDQVKRVKPGVVGTLWNAINYGVGPQTVMQKRAENMLALTDKKTARDKSAALAQLQAAWTPIIFAARTPEEMYQAQAGYASARAAILGPEAMGTAPNFLSSLEPTASKPESPIPNMSWVPDGNGGYRQLGSPAEKPPIIKEFADGIKASYDNGRTWEKIGDARHPETGGTSEPLTAIEGPDGNPVLVPRSQAVGQKPYSAGVGSAINQSSKARMVAAVGEMNNAHTGMAEFERGLANGTIKISASAQLLQRLANAFTHDDPVSQFTQSTALAILNRTDPNLARYIRRGLSFAEGESMISQRPSDFRTKMAAFLSTAASGASPEMVADIAGRRNAILNPLNEVVLRKRKLSASDLAKAKTDPEFAAWAKANGYEVP